MHSSRASFSIAWKKRELSCFGPVLFAGATGYVCAASQLRVNSYQFETAYPFFAAVWGYLSVRLYQEAGRVAREYAGRGRKWAPTLVRAVLIVVVSWAAVSEVKNVAPRYRGLADWWSAPDQFYANYAEQRPFEHLSDQLRVIRYLKEKAAPGDEVYIWGGAAMIYYLTGLTSPSRFVLSDAVKSPWGLPEWREELVRDLRKSPPAFVVVARNDAMLYMTFTRLDSEQYLKFFPELNAFISSSYRPVANFADFAIYRRAALP